MNLRERISATLGNLFLSAGTAASAAQFAEPFLKALPDSHRQAVVQACANSDPRCLVWAACMAVALWVANRGNKTEQQAKEDLDDKLNRLLVGENRLYALMRDHPTLESIQEQLATIDGRLTSLSHLLATGMDGNPDANALYFSRLKEGLKDLQVLINPDQFNQLLAAMGETRQRSLSNVEAPPDRYLVPRESLLQQVAALLERGEGVAMHSAMARGEGGQGKTWLARHYAFRFADRYPGGRLLLSCDNEKSLEELFAEAWGPEEGVEQAQRAQRVRQTLQTEPRWLLILDNVGSAERMESLRSSPCWPTERCHVLVTTREELHLPPVEVGRMTEEEGLDLLARYAPSTRQAPEAAKAIVREAEGLAVLLAAVGAAMKDRDKAAVERYATWLATYQPEDDALGVIEGYPVKAAAILDDLYTRLDAVQLRALEYAALLPPDRIRLEWLDWLLERDRSDLAWPTLPLLAELVPVSELLEKLVGAELLVESQSGKYSLHRLHRKRVLEVRITSRERALRANQLRALSNDLEERSDQTDAQYRFAEAAYHLSESIEILQALHEVLDQRGEWNLEFRDALATAHMKRGYSNMLLVERTGAELDYQTAAALWEEICENQGAEGARLPRYRQKLATAYISLAGVKAVTDDLTGGIKCLREGILILDGLQREIEEDHILLPELAKNLSDAYLNQANLFILKAQPANALHASGNACHVAEQRLKRISSHGEWAPALYRTLATAYRDRSKVLEQLERSREALSAAERSVDLLQTLKKEQEAKGRWSDPLELDLADSHEQLGNLHSKLGEPGKALQHYGAAIDIMRAIRTKLVTGDSWHITFRSSLAAAHYNRGEVRMELRDWRQALDDCTEAIAIEESIRDELEGTDRWPTEYRLMLSLMYRRRGRIYMSVNWRGDAVEDFRRAVLILRDRACEGSKCDKDLLNVLAAWFETRTDLSADLARLARVTHARFRASFPDEVLARSEVPNLCLVIVNNLDAVPDLSSAESAQIRAALLG